MRKDGKNCVTSHTAISSFMICYFMMCAIYIIAVVTTVFSALKWIHMLEKVRRIVRCVPVHFVSFYWWEKAMTIRHCFSFKNDTDCVKECHIIVHFLSQVKRIVPTKKGPERRRGLGAISSNYGRNISLFKL